MFALSLATFQLLIVRQGVKKQAGNEGIETPEIEILCLGSNLIESVVCNFKNMTSDSTEQRGN